MSVFELASRGGSVPAGVSRRRFVAAAPAVLAGLAWASKPGLAGTGEVEWLDEVQRPPSSPDYAQRHLSEAFGSVLYCSS